MSSVLLFSFLPPTKGCLLQKKSIQALYPIVLVMPSKKLRTVKVKASSREVAERRACKRVPEAIKVYRGEEI